MTNRDHFEEFEAHVGRPVADRILQDVMEFKLTEEDATDFAKNLDQLLDKKDRKVKGNFHFARTKPGYNYGERAMQCILSDFFDKYETEDRTTTTTILALSNALKSAGKKRLAKELENIGRETVTVPQLGASGGNEDQGIPANHAKMAGHGYHITPPLPKKPFKIKIQKTCPTSQEPIPSSQVGPVCASHAIGKAILKIIHLCGFDADQSMIIEALEREVQPNKKAKNPDEFHEKAIVVDIHGKDVKIGIDVQIDWSIIPNMRNEELTEKKIQRVIRDNPQLPHALYVKRYDHSKCIYECVNSHGAINPFPARDSSVYAVDYIQITEII